MAVTIMPIACAARACRPLPAAQSSIVAPGAQSCSQRSTHGDAHRWVGRVQPERMTDMRYEPLLAPRGNAPARA